MAVELFEARGHQVQNKGLCCDNNGQFIEPHKMTCALTFEDDHNNKREDPLFVVYSSHSKNFGDAESLKVDVIPSMQNYKGEIRYL